MTKRSPVALPMGIFGTPCLGASILVLMLNTLNDKQKILYY